MSALMQPKTTAIQTKKHARSEDAGTTDEAAATFEDMCKRAKTTLPKQTSIEPPVLSHLGHEKSFHLQQQRRLIAQKSAEKREDESEFAKTLLSTFGIVEAQLDVKTKIQEMLKKRRQFRLDSTPEIENIIAAEKTALAPPMTPTQIEAARNREKRREALRKAKKTARQLLVTTPDANGVFWLGDKDDVEMFMAAGTPRVAFGTYDDILELEDKELEASDKEALTTYDLRAADQVAAVEYLKSACLPKQKFDDNAQKASELVNEIRAFADDLELLVHCLK